MRMNQVTCIDIEEKLKVILLVFDEFIGLRQMSVMLVINCLIKKVLISYYDAF